MTGITKRFGDVTALEAVDFRAEWGVIQAIVGENGAGKTTLIKVLYGLHRADAGSIALDGRTTEIRSAEAAIAHRIGMVSQHYAIIPELTCLQNLLLGAEPNWMLDLKAAAVRAEKLAAKMGFRFNWHEPAANLSPASAQKLEILKLLWREARIMILDEPTAMLSPADADALYASLGKLATEGACVIVVTHRLPEVLNFCKTVTVLRRGRLIESKSVDETSTAALAELIIGHAAPAPSPVAAELGKVIAKAEAIRVKGYRGDDAVKEASFEIRAGEVVGVAGVDGSGQRELLQAILGVERIESGDFHLDGRDSSRKSVAERIADGVRIIPEDRLVEGAIPQWTLQQNAVLGLQREGRFRKGFGLDSSLIQTYCTKAADRFLTKRLNDSQRMEDLSGGNQQRFVVGRVMEGDPRLLLAFQPTRGLDIDGSAQIYADIRRHCRENQAAAIIVGFDLDELIEQCDRIVVMSGGRLLNPPSGKEKDRDEIGRLMVEAA